MSRTLPLRWWLFMLSLVVGAPLLALLAWMFAADLRREQAEARELALHVARGTAARLRTLHVESTALLDRMASRPAFQNRGADCDALFAVVEFFPQYATLILFDGSGNVRCSSEPEASDVPVAQVAQNWMQADIRAGRAISKAPVLRWAAGRWVSCLSRQTPAGILTLVQLPEVVADAPGLASTVITIIDSNGTVIARTSDPEEWYGRNVRNAEVTDLVLRQGEGRAAARGIDGTLRQYGFTSIPDLGWFIYAGIPASEILAPVRAEALRGLGIGVLLVVVVALFSFRLARGIQSPIDDLARAANDVSSHGFTGAVPVRGPREVEMLGLAFNQMVSRRAEAEARLTESEQNLKALSDRLLHVLEEERTRIARELHDDLGQSLTGLKMDVLGVLDRVGPNAAPALRERIERTLDSATKGVQRISAELRPSALDDLGLAAALELEARQFEERTAIECDLSVGLDTHIDSRTATAIYRIAQEALTNVIRHADATRVEIRLRERNSDIVMEVRDNGRGIDASRLSDSGSLGLIGMRERAAILGGSVHVQAVEGRGTIVSVRLPAEGAS